jgi:hypothetical protein
MSAAKVLKTKNKLFWVLQRKYNKDLHGTQSEHNIDVPLFQEKNPAITSMHTIDVFVDGKADLHVIRKKYLIVMHQYGQVHIIYLNLCNK